MRSRFWSACGAVGLALVLVGTTTDDACAQRGGGRSGGGGRGGGGGQAAGASREGPAASGSLSTNPSRTSGQGAQASGENQAARQQSRASAQASRQEQASSAQASRQQQASSAQANRQEVYEDEHWDAQGKGLAIAATGAAVAGTVAAVSSAAAPAGGRSAHAIRDCPRDGAARGASAAVCQPDNGAGRRSHVHQMRIDLVHTSLRRQRSRLRAVRPATRLLSGSGWVVRESVPPTTGAPVGAGRERRGRARLQQTDP